MRTPVGAGHGNPCRRGTANRRFADLTPDACRFADLTPDARRFADLAPEARQPAYTQSSVRSTAFCHRAYAASR